MQDSSDHTQTRKGTSHSTGEPPSATDTGGLPGPRARCCGATEPSAVHNAEEEFNTAASAAAAASAAVHVVAATSAASAAAAVNAAEEAVTSVVTGRVGVHLT
jgi:hypothetical protein